jgi:hypothetical protein
MLKWCLMSFEQVSRREIRLMIHLDLKKTEIREQLTHNTDITARAL